MKFNKVIDKKAFERSNCRKSDWLIRSFIWENRKKHLDNVRRLGLLNSIVNVLSSFCQDLEPVSLLCMMVIALFFSRSEWVKSQ